MIPLFNMIIKNYNNNSLPYKGKVHHQLFYISFTIEVKRLRLKKKLKILNFYLLNKIHSTNQSERQIQQTTRPLHLQKHRVSW